MSSCITGLVACLRSSFAPRMQVAILWWDVMSAVISGPIKVFVKLWVDADVVAGALTTPDYLGEQRFAEPLQQCAAISTGAISIIHIMKAISARRTSGLVPGEPQAPAALYSPAPAAFALGWPAAQQLQWPTGG